MDLIEKYKKKIKRTKKKTTKNPQNQNQAKKSKFPQKKATRKHYKQALLANAEAMQSAFYGFSYNYLLRVTLNIIVIVELFFFIMS